MRSTPSVRCQVDFSDASRVALRFAGTIAGHFRARMIVLAVEDPLLTEAIGLALPPARVQPGAQPTTDARSFVHK